MADCGSCNLCCLLLDIKSLAKPAHILCWNTGLHGGCAVHKEKPEVCAGFKCLWLQSQDYPDPLTRGIRSTRPDQCHVMFIVDPENENHRFCHVDPAHRSAWRQPPVSDYIDKALASGMTIDVVVGDLHIRLPEDLGLQEAARAGPTS